MWPQGREGSSPSLGTIFYCMPKEKLPFKEFQWTPELAYAVGLIATDGNLSPDGRHITLRSSEKILLKIFKKCLDLKNKISKTYNNGFAKRPSYKIQFGNVQFYRWLLNLGLTPAKSLTIGALKIPPEFLKDFLRGHLDGDGAVVLYKDTYNVYKGKRYTNMRIYTKFISASEKHVRWLHKMIRQNSPLRGALIHNKSKTRREMWEIKFSKHESLKLLRWLYYQPKLPALPRKKKLADHLIKKYGT